MSFTPEVVYKGPHPRNMIIAAIPITAKVIQPTTLENNPFVLPSRIIGFFYTDENWISIREWAEKRQRAQTRKVILLRIFVDLSPIFY